MLSIDQRDIKRFEKDLKTFASRAYPFASKNTVNQSAFTAMKIARINVTKDLTLRNRFTVQSIRVKQTKTLNVRRQAAIVGSTADYMEDQEFGAMKTKKGKEGIPIATAYSAGQGLGTRPRTRLSRKANKLQNIMLRRRQSKGKTRRQKNFIAVRQAAQSGQKFVYLDFGRSKGIFRVLGGKKKTRIKMVWDLSSKSIRIPRKPWLALAVKKTEKFIPGIYRESLIFQLKRNKLFGKR